MCFTKLKLLLIAIEAKGENGMDSYIAINPGQGARIQYATQGFFIAQSADEVQSFINQVLTLNLGTYDDQFMMPRNDLR